MPVRIDLTDRTVDGVNLGAIVRPPERKVLLVFAGLNLRSFLYLTRDQVAALHGLLTEALEVLPE